MSQALRPDLLTMIDTPKRKILGTPDLAQLREALGPGVLEGFCRCFVQMDRLLSFRNLANFTHQSSADTAKARDSHTVIWMFIGTLRELALAFGDLRAALKKADLLEKGSDWEEVQGFIERANSQLKNLRDTGSFHVDSALISRGLDELSSKPGSVVISVQEGGNDLGFSFSLGVDALHGGLGLTDAEGKKLMESLFADVDRVIRLLSKIFVTTTQRAKIPGIKI